MSLNGTVWTPIGPSPMIGAGSTDNGQVTAIAVNPNNPNVIYLGTAWGGVWLSRDGGDHWTPIFDHEPALGIGEPAGIAIDPVNTDIIYVGTSNRAAPRADTIHQPPRGCSSRPTAARAGFASVRAFRRATRAMRTFLQPGRSTSSSSIRPTHHVYLASMPACSFPAMAASTGPRRRGPVGDTRSLALDLTPASARVPVRGYPARRVPVHRWRAELDAGPQRRHARRSHGARAVASSSASWSRWRRQPRRPMSPASR